MSSLSWQEHIKRYYEQDRLEDFQKTRILPRPKTTLFSVMLYATLGIAVCVGFAIGLIVFSPLTLWIEVIIATFFLVCMIEFYGCWLAIKTIECYQHYAKEETRRRCMCIPSCSEYAILCLKKYGFFHALLKIRKRLFVTCKSFDFIIDNP